MGQIKEQVYAVVRIQEDLEFSETAISIVKILPKLQQAISEVDRLNKLNAAKGARYFWQATRYYPVGPLKNAPPKLKIVSPRRP